MKKSLAQLDNEILTLFEKRLAGLRDGTVPPAAFWNELAKAFARFEAVHEAEATDTPSWQSAFDNFGELLKRGPTEEQRQAEIEQLEKIIERRFDRLAAKFKSSEASH
jgi:hypothetical protein